MVWNLRLHSTGGIIVRWFVGYFVVLFSSQMQLTRKHMIVPESMERKCRIWFWNVVPPIGVEPPESWQETSVREFPSQVISVGEVCQSIYNCNTFSVKMIHHNEASAMVIGHLFIFGWLCFRRQTEDPFLHVAKAKLWWEFICMIIVSGVRFFVVNTLW